jgi:hypothetical protein
VKLFIFEHQNKSCSIYHEDTARTEGKFLVANFEFGGSCGMSLEGDCHNVEVTRKMELFVTFGMSF